MSKDDIESTKYG